MVKVNKKYKDRLFRMVFNRKEELLSLYNAISHSEYTNPEELEINTLDDVIYMKMKNDLAFLIDDVLNLWEHQSTWNPNMPVRGTLYIVEEYRKYTQTKKYVEEVAKDKLGLVNEGEIIYKPDE